MNWELRKIADCLGITEYPVELNDAFEAICKQGLLSTISDTLKQLHEEFDPFGEYYDFLLQGAEKVQHDKTLLTWLSLGVYYCKSATEKEAAAFPLPPWDESLARDAFPALLIAMEFPETVKRYRARGLSDTHIKNNLGSLKYNMHVHKITQGRVSLSPGLYGWMTYYTKARIVDFMGFNFQAWKWKDEAILLKNRKNCNYVFLLLKGKFTAEGTVAGIRGAENIPEFLEATLEETEDAFIGYRADGQRISTVLQRFQKCEWEAVLRPGDDVINFHIPRGADLTPAFVEKSIALASEHMACYYPECNFKFTVCTSWMLDPKLLDILPDASNIAQFGRHFILHPSGDTAGNACMSYVWPGENRKIGELSENTSLQRSIKSMMCRNSFIFWTTGVWI